MITGEWVGAELPPAGSGVTSTALTPLMFSGSPMLPAPLEVTLNSVLVGDGAAVPRCNQTS